MRDRILSEIKRLASDNGGQPPGRQTFERETGIRKAEWYGRYWARWGDALVEAGFTANDLTPAWDRDLLLSKLAQAYRHFGRVATHGELKLYRQTDPTFPWTQTLDKTFGTKPEMIAALRQWAARCPDYGDVLALLPAQDAPPRAPRARSRNDGSVYLLKSGAYFKIGRSDQIERRVKEITIAQPEPVELVHVITTDDPPGIEAYWHQRFRDQRARGEWFKLSTADVLAFKRRKFQ